MGDSLSEVVKSLADEPTADHQDCFFQLFGTSMVAIPAAKVPDDLNRDGSYVVGNDDHIAVPQTQGPDGCPWLMVYCDAATMHARDKSRVWVELSGRTILELAKRNETGIIEQDLTGSGPSWAGITAAQVGIILTWLDSSAGRDQ